MTRRLALSILAVLAFAAGTPAQEQPPTAQEESDPDVSLAAPNDNGAASAPRPAPPTSDPATRDPGDRYRVIVPFAEESGGGRAVAFAEEIRQEEGLWVLLRRVEIYYQDMVLRGERAEIDPETKIATALGEVIVDQGPSRLTGMSLTFDLEAKTGVVYEASGYVSSDYYFRGREIRKTGDQSFSVVDGVFTSCNQDVPSWSFRTAKAEIVVDGFAKARHATLRVKKAPVFYLPYILWPVKEDRTSGFLVPKPGFSSRRGSSLGLAYYKTFGPSYDATVELDLFSEDYLGLGGEFRYQPTEGTGGRFEAYFLDDPEFGETRWKLRLDHESRDLPWGLRGGVNYEDVSDFDFFLDFERQVQRNSQRQLYSIGYLSGNWGRQSLNVIFDQRETFFTQDSVVELRQLPEIDYKLRSTQIGELPLYLQARSSLHYLDVDRGPTLDTSYGRGDLFPELSVPLRAFPWLNISFTGGLRYTWWGDSLRIGGDPEDPDSESEFRGDSLDRFITTANAEVVGPSFSRIFNAGGKNYSRFKHVMEPRFSYFWLEDFDEQSRIPRFDEIDLIGGQNLGSIAFINRLLAKPADEGSGGAREILSVELSQLISLDDERFLQSSQDGEIVRRTGPLTGLLRFNPSRRTTVRTDVRYNTIFSRVESTALSASVGFGTHDVGLRWTTRSLPDDGSTRTNQFRVSGNLTLVPNRLRLISVVNYDAQEKLLQLQRHILDYTGSCYGLRFEYGDFRGGGTSDRRDREFRFSITLKNVGTFLDLTGGDYESL